MAERLYLDTSVPSAYFDDRRAERQQQTHHFWSDALPEYDVFVSDVTVRELAATPDAARRRQLLDLVRPFSFVAVTKPVKLLAELFLEDTLVPIAKVEDAYHLAIAMVEGMDYLVSWNFDDMVNVKTKRLFPMLCAKHGYLKHLMILSPLEF